MADGAGRSESDPERVAEAPEPEPLEAELVEPPVVEPETIEVAVEPVVPPPASEEAGERIVFVETPAPPKNRSNRATGVALALLGAVAFAVAYALAVFILVLAGTPSEFVASVYGWVVGGAVFWIPVLFFTVSFVLLVLALNRAGWWVHILASIVVGLVTFFGSIGVLLLLDNVIFMTPAEASAAFLARATEGPLILAGLLAREVSIWVGLVIATRGRQVKARNAERRLAFERDLERAKAEREQATTPS